MKAPEFSIIIPTYNAAQTLDKAIKSISEQTYRNFEIVIIDGLSSDGTMQIVKNYSDFININFVSEKDEGIYDAMNKGLKMAKGKWVYFLGSDDWFYNEDVLLKISKKLSDADVDIIYGNSIWMPEEMVESGEWGYSRLLNQSINHQRVFYKKELFEKFGYFDPAYKVAADHALNIRFFCKPPVKKMYVDLPISYYHSGGFSSNKIDEAFWNNWKNILLKNFSPYLSKKEIYNKVAWYCWYNIQNKNYKKAFNLFCNIYINTFSFKFIKHTISQILKNIKAPTAINKK